MKKILIIEDNAEIRENTAELLELNKYQVLTAETGYGGFELAKMHRPEVILCDMLMPGTDGEKFLMLAKADPMVNTIPVIFFSAGSIAPGMQQTFENNAKDYLRKPFTEEELLKSIRKALQ
jgi:CRP/FNR family transcriptional regulator, cyclic AMP receptor protein